MNSVQILHLRGVFNGHRYLVQIDGNDVYLTGKAFVYLFGLAYGFKCNPDGWTRKEDLEPGFNQHRYVYRLISEIRAAGLETDGLIENDRRGNYRLDRTVRLEVDWLQLRTFPDVTVRNRVGCGSTWRPEMMAT